MYMVCWRFLLSLSSSISLVSEAIFASVSFEDSPESFSLSSESSRTRRSSWAFFSCNS